MKEMPQLLEQVDASQSSSKPQRLSLLLVDLDRLKPINDEFGHEAGALEGVATVLRGCLSDYDPCRALGRSPGWASLQEVLNLADMTLDRAKVRRDAWLGWCGLPRAARQTELLRLMSVDPHTALRAGYIDVRCSPRKDDRHGDDVEIPTRRVRGVGGQPS